MSSAIVLAEAMRAATERLDAAGVASPRYDAEVLAACALDAERSAIRTWTAMGARVDQAAADDFDQLVQRRCRREPLQHITGRAPFAGVELAVGPGVFIPRPESELLVQLAVDFVRGVSNASTPVRVVDLCAGSGAIGLAILTQVTQGGGVVHLQSVELDDDAVLWLRRNAEALATPEQMQVRHEDATAAMPEVTAEIDVVVCNPPYIPLGAEIRDPEVARYDPARALWGGRDGLDVIRGITAVAERLLRPGGLLLIEHADVQGESIPAHLAAQRHGDLGVWTEIRDLCDLNDRPRCTYALRSPMGAR